MQRSAIRGIAAQETHRISLRDGQDAQVPRSAWMRESGLHASYLLD